MNKILFEHRYINNTMDYFPSNISFLKTSEEFLSLMQYLVAFVC